MGHLHTPSEMTGCQRQMLQLLEAQAEVSAQPLFKFVYLLLGLEVVTQDFDPGEMF